MTCFDMDENWKKAQDQEPGLLASSNSCLFIHSVLDLIYSLLTDISYPIGLATNTQYLN
jgi:hypothetical protein